MFSVKKGFLLSEALLSMAVVSLLVLIVFQAVSTHADIRKSLRTSAGRISTRMTETYRIQEEENYIWEKDSGEDLSLPISSSP